MDKASQAELLKFILESIGLIRERFEGIDMSDDFLDSREGLTRLDAISMRLQSIGEAVKTIDKRDRALLLEAADSNYWSKIIKTREIITHHYVDIDSEIIYMICNEKMDELERHITMLLERVQNSM